MPNGFRCQVNHNNDKADYKFGNVLIP